MGCRCCSRPHGNLVFLPIIFTAAAFILSNAATRWCDYVRYTGTKVSELVYPSNIADTIHEVDVGLWAFSNPADDYRCYYFPKNYPFDTKFKSARVFSVWTTLFGGICMIVLLWTTCVPFKKGIWAIIAFFLFLNTLFEGLTLLVFRSEWCRGHGLSGTDNQCTLNYGSRCGIAAIFFWFFAAISIALIPPGDETVNGRVVMKETTTTTKTINPDGTEVVTTTSKVEKGTVV